ncbi:MAG: winged helix-turn-helix transcriptional regulator [Armatimonadetes bacterium]|nr:winged helix-turn-helix transcriptional regulator [Armatimonadota bacterium]
MLRKNADVFKALGNEQRSAIICALSDGEMAVSEIAEYVGLSIQNVSQHLRVLKEAGVVRDRREGRRVYYALANRKFLAACCLIRDAILEQYEMEGECVVDAGQLIFGGKFPPAGNKRGRKSQS